VIALQLLAGTMRPPPLMMLIMLLAISAGASALAYFVSVISVTLPGAYGLGVGLLYLWGFGLAFSPKGGPIGVMIVTMCVVVTSLSGVSTGLALGIVVELVFSVGLGAVLVYVAYAAFPTPPDANIAAAKPKDAPTIRMPAPVRATVCTMIILPLHLYLNADGLAALPILLTTATMLRQPGIAESQRYCLGYATGNAIGGLAAGVSVFVMLTQGNFATLVAITAAFSMYFAWKIVQAERWAPILLPGFVAYIVLFGLSLSPITPPGPPEVLERVIQILIAAVYSFAAASIVYPFFARKLPSEKQEAS
ncbi:MAG: FUSC family protein, partial [Pseudomonadota bacterium]